MASDETPEEVPDGTTGAGENTCRKCEGSGKVDGRDCPDCGGVGVVTDPERGEQS